MLKNTTVFFEKGKFGGWPANNGMWNWGNEILVGFSVDEFEVDPEGGHALKTDAEGNPISSGRIAVSRSLDGGETWDIAYPHALQLGKTLAESSKLPLFTDEIDFSNPNTIMLFKCEGTGRSPVGYWFYSIDKGYNWQGPYGIPRMGTFGVAARNEYVVMDKHELFLTFTCPKRNNEEGRVFVSKLKNGGKEFEFLSFVGPELMGNREYTCMPATYIKQNGQVLILLRVAKKKDILNKYDDRVFTIEQYLGSVNGNEWVFDKIVSDTGGNPPALLKLQDGRLCLAYGYRKKPYGLRCRYSSDEGETWSEEVILRSDAGCWDLGYPRIVQRDDGAIVSAYYYNDGEYSERYIAATIWDDSL